MSRTSSNPSDWIHLYRDSLVISGHPAPPPAPEGGTDSAMIGTSSSSNHATSAAASIEGRVTKPPRRRSRASRKAPTTLLNTDTTNFRAMVQQFTGVPSAPPYSSSGGRPNIDFGIDRVGPYDQTQHYQLGSQTLDAQYGNTPNGVFLQAYNDQRAGMDASDGFFFDGLPGGHNGNRSGPSSTANDGYFL